ncbi:MAG TPA: rhomboid family intramembrane serine protease [Pirellulaceae bacterium]|nr:rhomboid family intramembrane serine protease [Pirellulaceae bacterium]
MIFPLGDDNRDRRTVPVVNIGLIVVNILVFVVFQQFGTNEQFTMSFSTVPKEIVTGRDVITPAHVEVEPTVEGPQQVTVPGLGKTPISVYLTLLTSMFMHGGLAHIAGNMWFLWIFGDNIEDDMGRWRYLVFYLLCGILASLAHVLVSAGGSQAEVPSLGASGAISGVLGAYLVLHPTNRVTVLMLRMVMNVPGYVAVGLWFLFQIVSGLGMLGGTGTGGGVAYAAHVGGFIAGAALVRPFLIGRPPPQRDQTQSAVAGW